MMKSTSIFILGAAVGILGYVLAESPFDPFHNWSVEKECEAHYAKELNMTSQEFVHALQQIKQQKTQ